MRVRGRDAPFLVVPAGAGRDLQGAGGRAAALAQVLAAGETTLVLACSVAHACADLATVLPFSHLTRGRLQCVSCGCCLEAGEDGAVGRVTLAAWDVVRGLSHLEHNRHLLAVDPPYRVEHVETIHRLIEAGVQVHLCYGEKEREETARLLRYLVHPRFATVCMYRARQTGAAEDELPTVARQLAWREAKVVLCDDLLARAAELLEQLQLGQDGGEGAKIKLDTIPLYLEAQAEYEECSRLCRIL